MAACGVERDNDVAGEEILISKNGWGGRIRTHGWRYQKPLPYHLATPQHCCFNERVIMGMVTECKKVVAIFAELFRGMLLRARYSR
jgi:hypothetical protein